MCLAYPMKVVSRDGINTATCEKDGELHCVDTTFLSEVQIGDWVTVHLGIAREVMTEADARQILDALHALDMVKQGETQVDHLFADLIGREPPRPPSADSD
ncbi:HypC/HybG/HupF family hydrogenase formation chaperone [Celeribacter litoreus]|uniref:HypC/HybG/HupF family hydrogenase formation chaperone n=1 Tax=Celeribacter litoreus TaxID=2876714 RepID=UPI001CCF5A53|nr:HypC/HybG/HupF family hydrogenase formation chaperone [Celeribacter litoreus]MCA0044372.1 HypC/HybG/HupF family hydrogenase formation chaperone [Celeribacter litoreus]